jgi:putative hydrolase of the HAD superfamily
VSVAVTLDAAGTLIAPAEPVGVTYARIAADFGIALDATSVETGFRRAMAAAPPLAFPGTPASERLRHERAWWRDVVRVACGAEVPSACFDALFAHYAAASAWRVFPDARPALATLARRGMRVGVISNFDGRLPTLLERLDLASSLDAIVWSSEAGAAKPDPAIFAAAARALGVPVTALRHVGNDPHADAAGARAAGATAILLDRDGTAPDAVHDLEAAVARALAQP